MNDEVSNLIKILEELVHTDEVSDELKVVFASQAKVVLMLLDISNQLEEVKLAQCQSGYVEDCKS